MSLQLIKKEDVIESEDILNNIIEEKGFDKEKLRLNIGSGKQKFSNCINVDLKKHKHTDVDIEGNIVVGLPFPNETFTEILFIHVIEHIQRKFHRIVLDEIWRLLKPDGRLILAYPDFIEAAKRFIENKYGGRWQLYHNVIYGRQSYEGDYHVAAIERQDITDRLINSGFKDINYLRHTINVTITAYKGEKLKEFL